jgi:RNA polymerase sigma-70 factor (ECF subfamily)
MRENRKDDQQSPVQARFATTHWSIIQQARGSDAEYARQALEKLIAAYWYPLYAFARKKGHSDHDAMDLTQGYFAFLLSSGGFDNVSPERGQFRSFLLASFTNFISNQRRAANAQRRSSANATFSLSAPDFKTRYDLEPATDQTPELLFQRSWVESLLNLVRTRLAGEYEAAGKTEIFALLEPHMAHAVDALPREQISRQLKISAAALSMSLHRMRRRYGELLREEIAATVDDPTEIDAELKDLMSALSR